MTNRDEIADMQRNAERVAKSFEPNVRVWSMESASTELVSLWGFSERMVLPWNQVEQWLREYRFPKSIRLDPPTADALAQGVCGVLVLGSVTIAVKVERRISGGETPGT
jgi:hypothetical protein